MKYIAKMMLALLASVTMVAQAYAWDFGVTGSAEATFNQASSNTGATGADTITTQEFGSAAGSIVITSSHSSGDSSAAFSYTFDWDDNYDEVVKLSGSTKAGEWTASSAIDFNRDSDSAAEEDRPNIAITNGTTTIHMGLIAPVGSQSTTGGAVSGGNVAFGRDDGGIGAYIDEYQGVGVTHKVSDTITVAAALQMDKDAAILGEYSNVTASSSLSNGTQTTAQALSVSANVGPVIGFSFGTGENKAVNSNDNATTGGYKASLTTMGLGVTMDLGGPSLALTYATISGKQSAASDSKFDDTGMAVSFSMPMGSDSVVASFTSVTQKTDTGTAVNASATGFEVGYNTTIGPVSLGLGYGSSSYSADTGATFAHDGGGNGFDSTAATGKGDGATSTDLEVKMAYSW